MNVAPSLKQKLGCWLHERWRTELTLRWPAIARMVGMTWLDLRNRGERLGNDPATGGRICKWDNSSVLTVSRVFPKVGQRLLEHCLREWPIQLDAQRSCITNTSDPVVSVIIGVRGTGRLEQFNACIDALHSQTGVDYEIIVVEQSWNPEFSSLVANDVTYIHQESTSPDMPYNRSWALNRGAMEAKGRILVLHDADMLLPKGALAAIVEIIDRGLDAVRLPRLLFYLDSGSSAKVQSSRKIHGALGFERIIANNRTPLAVTRECYLEIGGHDEGFYGWGGEDDEFMDRLRTRKVGEGAVLPIVHLWHSSAAHGEAKSRNAALLQHLLAVPSEDRIDRMRCLGMGAIRPATPWAQQRA